MFLGSVYFFRPADGVVAAQCEQMKDTYLIKTFTKENLLLEFSLSTEASVQILPTLRTEFLGNPNTLKIIGIGKTSKISFLTIDCNIVRAFFEKDNKQVYELKFKHSADNSEIYLDANANGFEKFEFWIIGAALTFSFFYIIFLSIFLMAEDFSLIRKTISILGLVLIGINQLRFSPGLLNAANPIYVMDATINYISSAFEGAVYHICVNSVLTFIPDMKILSLMLGLIVLILFISFLFLFRKSTITTVVFLFSVAYMCLASPAFVSYIEYLERSTVCLWLFMCLLNFIYFVQVNKKIVNFKNGNGLIVGIFLLMLTLLRYEFLVVSIFIIATLFKTDFKTRLKVALGFSAFVVLFSNILENQMQKDSDWRNLYYTISLYPYVKEISKRGEMTAEEIKAIGALFDLEKLKKTEAPWNSIYGQKHIATAEIKDLIAVVIKDSINRPINFLISRFELFRISISGHSWIFTEPTQANINNDKIYIDVVTNNFIGTNTSENEKQKLYTEIINDNLFLSRFTISILLVVLCFRWFPASAYTAVLIVVRVLFVLFLLPSKHLVYVLDAYIMGIPILLMAYNEFMTNGLSFRKNRQRP